jgi:hypothetical protein
VFPITHTDQINGNIGYFEITEYTADGSTKQIYKTNSYTQQIHAPYNLTFIDTHTNKKITTKGSYMVQKVEQ